MSRLAKFSFMSVLTIIIACNPVISQNHNNMEKTTNKNGGIVFFATEKLDSIADFYIEKVGCELWLDQGACKILKHGNMLFGFCKSDHVDKEAVITFFYPKKEMVDSIYKQMEKYAEDDPKMNPKFNIYHFYGRDPENRTIEFQYFEHELKEY
mgnify:CR=1 FL=1